MHHNCHGRSKSFSNNKRLKNSKRINPINLEPQNYDFTKNISKTDKKGNIIQINTGGAGNHRGNIKKIYKFNTPINSAFPMKNSSTLIGMYYLQRFNRRLNKTINILIKNFSRPQLSLSHQRNSGFKMCIGKDKLGRRQYVDCHGRLLDYKTLQPFKNKYY